ncbi:MULTISPECIES: rhomboid family intramembrane serine protease [Tenacibaculum]|uniref:rhomboid family intramembrane serine protease n=1 Tax=Tenacibaculum TaxID=104267 RepID=UPI001F0ABCDF|nr:MULTISPECIES: rhomboid family intramembrane serine protease [Tenacibaculum]MCH3883196.1 rhomboid family intramembrane serine protease [Tenacibaculum aquimarinum]MDO6600959.1 rhomboid family intramembrane serine protease [Tenacibaculum sp. 1_MG-2023]
MQKLTDAIKHLIIINVILFVGPMLLKMDLTNIFALHFPKNEHFGVWQYITHMFMHGSPMHLIFNMYGLWAFGTPLEQMWGKKKFLFFYFSAGIGAGIIYTLVNYYQFNGIYEQLVGFGLSASDIQNILSTGSYNESLISLTNEEMTEFYSLYHTPAVGASGAIYGVLVAFGIAFPNAKLALIFFPVPIAAKYFIPLMIVGDLFFGVTKYSIGNVAHFAHIGGAIIGFIIAWYWKKDQFKFN